MNRRDYCWGVGNEDVVLRAYGSVAVHENPYGDVVVRQEADALEEDDHWVVIPVQDAELVAQAIVEKAKEIKSLSIAERQAKHEQDDREPRLTLPLRRTQRQVPPSSSGGWWDDGHEAFPEQYARAREDGYPLGRFP
jgi:hypothetical protein